MAENILSQAEVDALLTGVADDQEGKSGLDTAGVHSYNLAAQEHIVRGRLPTLEMINERFVRLFRIGLFNLMSQAAEVSVGPVRIVKYSDFIRHLVVPASLNLVQIKPLPGTMLMVLDPALVFSVVDNMFGGDGRFHTRIEGRDFTMTEQRIIKRVLDIVFEAYAKSWQPVYPVEFAYICSEMNIQFANIATPHEVVVATTFNIELGTVRGEIHFCMPYSTIEPVLDQLASPLQGEILEVDKRWARLMTQQIQSAEVELVANIGTTNMRVGDILNMKIGDVIPLSIDNEIVAKVDNAPVMSCKYGIFNGQYALRVQKLLKSNATEYVKGGNNDD